MEKMSRIYKTRPLLSVEEIIHDEIQSCLNKLQLDLYLIVKRYFIGQTV